MRPNRSVEFSRRNPFLKTVKSLSPQSFSNYISEKRLRHHIYKKGRNKVGFSICKPETLKYLPRSSSNLDK